MRVAVVGSGAVGGYFGAKLAQGGQDVTFIARGAHLAAIREHGLRIQSAKLGDFTVHAPAVDDPAEIGPVDLVLFTVKAYDNQTALNLLGPLVGESSVVLTLQNGVDSADEVASAVGRARVLGGTTYVATALASPGVIVQTGVHRSIIFGEVFGERGRITPRVQVARRPADGGRYPRDASRRRPRTHLGQVRVPRAVLRLHRRRASPDRRPLVRAVDSRDVLRRRPRSRRPRGGRGRHHLRRPLRDAASTTWTTSRPPRDRRC